MDDHYSSLDFTTRPIEDFQAKVKYVATKEEHSANVEANVALGYPSLEKGELKTDPLALVCYGPSLKHTRRDIRHFKYVLSCSGAHQFLIDHGIVPTWHMEGDPRAHKAKFIRHPHRRTQYLLAASCHPAVFQAVKGYDVRIWHTLRNAEDLVGQDHYPVGHWALTGGTNIGMRALVMGRLLGFTDIHIFGMDCSAEGKMHAGDHPNEVPEEKYRTVRVGDREFQSTTTFLSYAKGFFHEILQLPDVHATLHGDGLLQALIKQKLEDPEQLQKWLEERENVVATTVAVVQREVAVLEAERAPAL